MKTATAVLVSTVLLGMPFGTALAESCYKLNPFVDVLRLNQTTVADDVAVTTHTAVNGNWIASGFYSLPVTGSLEVNIPGGGVRLGLHGTNNSSVFFVGHGDCILDGFPNGAWFLSCDSTVPGIYNNSGSPLSQVSCDTLGSSEPIGGVPAGRAPSATVR